MYYSAIFSKCKVQHQNSFLISLLYLGRDSLSSLRSVTNHLVSLIINSLELKNRSFLIKKQTRAIFAENAGLQLFLRWNRKNLAFMGIPLLSWICTFQEEFQSWMLAIWVRLLRACDKAPKNMADLTDGRALIKDPLLKNPGHALAVPTIFFSFFVCNRFWLSSQRSDKLLTYSKALRPGRIVKSG